MKKLFIIALVILLSSCTAPKVQNVSSKLPEGYSKAYYITTISKSTTMNMTEFVKSFSSESDCVITINDYTYLILRK